MATIPRLTMRANRQVELVLPAKPTAMSFVVGAADTLNTAFSGTTEMFRVPSGGTYRSPNIRERGLGRTYYSNRGLSRALYDPEDFWSGGSTIPHDFQTAYLRVSEVSPAGTVGPEGPIFVLTPPAFFDNPRPVLTLSGTAPSVTPLASGLPPTTAMHIALPKFTDNIRIRNLSATDELFVCFSPGQAAYAIPTETTENFFDAAVSDIFLFGDGATVDFQLVAAVVNGEMG